MKKILFCIAMLLVVGKVEAKISDCAEFYVAGLVGYNIMKDIEVDKGVMLGVNNGYTFGTALGYRFNDYSRLEAEVSFRDNTFSALRNDKGETLSLTGHLRKLTAFANGCVDIPIFEKTWVLSAGVGVGEKWDFQESRIDPVEIEDVLYYFERKTEFDCGFAYQYLMGLTLCFNHRTEAAVEYRYLDGVQTPPNHTVDLILQYHF